MYENGFENENGRIESSESEAQRGSAVPGTENKKKNRRWIKITAIVLGCIIAVSAAVWGGTVVAERIGGVVNSVEDKIVERIGSDSENAESEADTEAGFTLQMGKREDSTIKVNEIDTSKMLTPAEVYALNVHSTVGVTVGVTVNYFGYKTTSPASGSGFIISKDGYILTNYHVIEDANSVTVTDYDGNSYDAIIVGYDDSNDIAVLKIDAEDLIPVTFGDSDNMNVGDTVIAIGNPLGELTFSLTQGVISALGREITLSGGITMNLIQTDCAINAGNSGGALFNLYGEVIGITNAKYSSSSMSSASIDNIGFAIPVNSITGIVGTIIEKGYVTKPYLGVYLSNVDSSYQAYGLPSGAAISSVIEDSPAEKAGILANDIITGVNGEEIKSADDLQKVVGAAAPGDVMEFTIYRQGETLKLNVTIGEKKQGVEQPQQEEKQENDNSGYGYGFPFDFPFMW